MLPKLDDNGDPAPLKSSRPNGRTVKEERRTIETFQEHYLDNNDAINAVVDIFAVNKNINYANCNQQHKISLRLGLSFVKTKKY
jgi:hypothetical protein